MKFRVNERDWQIWLGLFLTSILVIFSAYLLDSFADSLPTITVTPRQVLDLFRFLGIVIAPIAGVTTIYMFLFSSPSTEEHYASILGELDDIPTNDELVDLLAEHSDGEHPLEAAEILVSFIVPPEILEDIDRVYGENYEQIIEIANMQRPKPSDNVEYHHPIPLAYEIGLLVTIDLSEEIEEEVQGDVLNGASRYITAYHFGIRAMQDAGISVDQSQ